MRLRELFTAGGGARRLQVRARSPWPLAAYAPTRDLARPDYPFWDRARRAGVPGLELSGLLLRPLSSKAAAWVLGDPPAWNDPRLARWWLANHAAILRAYEESLALGDCFLVINADGMVTVVPPHVVEPLWSQDEDQIGAIAGWQIAERFPDGTGVIDCYTDRRRERTIERPGRSPVTTRYPNPIGRAPIVHLANGVGADEVFGRPEGEALIPALRRYGAIFEAALNGNIRQGRPTPVIERMGSAEQVARFWERFGRRETVTEPDGTQTAIDVIDFDPDQLLTLGGEASFDYKAPGSFSKDTETLLGLLFYLVLEHSEIPEFAWGGAIASSKASAETQREPFVQWIAKKRSAARAWMLDVAAIAAALLMLETPGAPPIGLGFAWPDENKEN